MALEELIPPIKDALQLGRGFVLLPVGLLLATNITPKAKLLYATLLDLRRTFGEASVGQERLAHLLGLNERSIRKHLRVLIEARLVVIEHRGPYPNVYHFLPLHQAALWEAEADG